MKIFFYSSLFFFSRIFCSIVCFAFLYSGVSFDCFMLLYASCSSKRIASSLIFKFALFSGIDVVSFIIIQTPFQNRIVLILL